MTCNYEARRRGLYKLQLIREAKRVCPDVIIELGEDISRFRDASKELYLFVKEFSWNDKIERLGFDEIWMDTTDIVEYNISILNKNNLKDSFFQISKDDPTAGFSFDATAIAGHSYPAEYAEECADGGVDDLTLRLRLGSHLALHIRHQLEQQKGYTSTVGIATTKLLSKLVGNLNKPKGQTTLVPPLEALDECQSNVTRFMDDHEIGKVPGIGYNLAKKLRKFYKRKQVGPDSMNDDSKEPVTVAELRNHPDVNAEMLEQLLAGPGSAHGIGSKIWSLLHGVDDSEVSSARPAPKQISIEDSYIRLDNMSDLLKALTALSRSLIIRMRVDLLASTDDFEAADHTPEDDEQESREIKPPTVANKRWVAHPKSLRLTTRPRLPLQPDGTRVHSFKRSSHSIPLPNFVFNLNESIDALAEKLVKEVLTRMFRKLHPEKTGWNLSLINVGVTNMAEAAGNSRTANGRDISNMFRRQEDVLKDFRVTDTSPPAAPLAEAAPPTRSKKRVRFDDTPTVMHIQAFEDTLPVRKAAKIVKEKPKETEVILAVQEVEKEPEVEDATLSFQEVEEPPTTMFADDEEDINGWINEDGVDDFTEVCRDCGLTLPEFEMIVHRRVHQTTLGSEDSLLVPD